MSPGGPGPPAAAAPSPRPPVLVSLSFSPLTPCLSLSHTHTHTHAVSQLHHHPIPPIWHAGVHPWPHIPRGWHIPPHIRTGVPGFWGWPPLWAWCTRECTHHSASSPAAVCLPCSTHMRVTQTHTGMDEPTHPHPLSHLHSPMCMLLLTSPRTVIHARTPLSAPGVGEYSLHAMS